MTLLIPTSIVLILAFSQCLATGAALPHANRGLTATLPISRRSTKALRKRQNSGTIGLGDSQDAEYTVQIKIGSDNVPVIFDTGSSDLWSISSDCTSSSCGSLSGAHQISTSSLKTSGVDARIDYGDSAHPTFASGTIVSGPVTLAGLQVNDQFVAAVNATTTGLSDEGISGIFGAGFPNPESSSVIFGSLLANTMKTSTSFSGSETAITDAFISELSVQGPLMSRLASGGQLKQPMFTVTLQRETVEVGGNVGQLTIGQLPDGVSNDSLTWVPVRLYTATQGGLAGSSTAPNEAYPIRWEVTVDDVLLNGQTLPKPNLAAGIGYTALIDSGTSFLAGPQTVVNSVYNSISTSSGSSSANGPSISCNTPVKLTYVIGGKQFPVDPRDFLGQQSDTRECNAGSLSPTDAPSAGGLMSWILGDPFMKSNLVAFYYGNLTHPSVDPPRMGFLSTVPSNADDLYRADVKAAQSSGEFVDTSVIAPTATSAAAATNSAGVPQASSEPAKKNGGLRLRVPGGLLAATLVLTMWAW